MGHATWISKEWQALKLLGGTTVLQCFSSTVQGTGGQGYARQAVKFSAAEAQQNN